MFCFIFHMVMFCKCCFIIGQTGHWLANPPTIRICDVNACSHFRWYFFLLNNKCETSYNEKFLYFLFSWQRNFLGRSAGQSRAAQSRGRLCSSCYSSPGRLTRPCFMGLQFPSCTTFELIEVFIPDQLHHGAYCRGNYGTKNGCRLAAAAGGGMREEEQWGFSSQHHHKGR